MKTSVVFGLALIASASCQIYTQQGPDGYKYPKPPATFNIPRESGCSNGGSGQFCCTNGARNVDCCTNGGSGQFCCTNGARNIDCCTNGGSGQFCCTNGARNVDCCTNGGTGQYCELPTPPTPTYSAPQQPLPAFIPAQPLPRFEDLATPPPLPSFIPLPSLPSIISVNPAKPASASFPKVLPVKPIVASTPAPFQPVVYREEPFNADGYLPPDPILDVRNEETDWESWKAKFGKSYDSPEEEERRRAIFEENVGFITSHNEVYRARRSAFNVAANSFCDLMPEEFVKIHTGIRESRSAKVISKSSGYAYGVGISGSIKTSHSAGHSSGQSSHSNSNSNNNDFSSDVILQDEDIRFQEGNIERETRPRSNMNVFMPSPILEAETEDEVDWRKKGAVTPVKNQGSCASCWAFAANGALEAQHFLKNGKLVSLSEQNLVDCVKENDGCDGGDMTSAFEYVRRNPGVQTEASYPYETRNTTCRFDRSNVGANLIDWMEIQEGNEVALKQAVATVGPVAAGVDGAQRSFMFYKSGFYFDPKCDTEVNHAVVVVGYGKTEAGEEYWLCKNSWDTDWGEEGYIRMARNKNNHCGITSLASYPLV